jgi:hypothetical protein
MVFSTILFFRYMVDYRRVEKESINLEEKGIFAFMGNFMVVLRLTRNISDILPSLALKQYQ